MEQKIPDDIFDKLPKVLWEHSRMAYGKDFITVAIRTGQNIGLQLLTPEHAKEVMQQLKWCVDEYEKNYRKIESNWTPNVVSPIQLPPKDSK